MSTATLKVVNETLVRYGRERYEDAIVFHAVGSYIDYVGRIPANAWGQLPWSATWRDRWDKGLDHRVTEAHTMRDHTAEHAAAMLTVAANYTHTDIQAATNFDLANEYVATFLGVFVGAPPRTGHYRPGGPAPAPMFGDVTVSRLPDSNDEFRKVNAEHAPGDGGVCSPSNPLGINFQAGVVGDELDRFVAEYGEDMLCSEYVAAQHEPDVPRPFSDYILPAWRCVPSTIRNRAELLYEAQHTYDECWDHLKHDIATVRDNWLSPGASLAWFHQATAQLQYLEDISGEVKWLADQGISAASLVEGMRNRFAQYGHERAKDIIELAKAVVDAEADVLGGIGDCKSNPVKALSEAMQGFADALLIEQRQTHDAAIGLIVIDEQRRREQVDPGTLAHDSLPYPAEDIDWDNAAEWTPNQATGPGAPA